MIPVSDRFQAAVRSSHRMAVRARIVAPGQTGSDPDGVDIPVLDGDVSCDATADVRCTCDITTDGSMWAGAADELLTPYGAEVFLSRGVYFGGSAEFAPLGYFRLSSVEQDSERGPLRLAGQDRMAALKDAQLIDAVQFDAQNRVAGVFDRLVHDVLPNVDIGFDYDAGADELGRSQVAGGTDDDSDADRHAFLTDLVTSRGKIMWFDGNGRLRVADPPDPTMPVFTVDAGPDGVLVQAARSLSRDGVYNAVVATGEAADDKPPVRAVVMDNNPNSPTYWRGDFGQVPLFYSSSNIKTESFARLSASRLLAQKTGLPYTIDLTAVPNPALEPLDPVRVRFRDGSTETHVLEKIAIPLVADQPLTATTRQRP